MTARKTTAEWLEDGGKQGVCMTWNGAQTTGIRWNQTHPEGGWPTNVARTACVIYIQVAADLRRHRSRREDEPTPQRCGLHTTQLTSVWRAYKWQTGRMARYRARSVIACMFSAWSSAEKMEYTLEVSSARVRVIFPVDAVGPVGRCGSLIFSHCSSGTVSRAKTGWSTLPRESADALDLAGPGEDNCCRQAAECQLPLKDARAGHIRALRLCTDGSLSHNSRLARCVLLYAGHYTLMFSPEDIYIRQVHAALICACSTKAQVESK